MKPKFFTHSPSSAQRPHCAACAGSSPASCAHACFGYASPAPSSRPLHTPQLSGHWKRITSACVSHIPLELAFAHGAVMLSRQRKLHASGSASGV